MIRIIVDSSSDYRLEEIKEKNMELIPITVTIGEKSYQDGITLERDTFYQLLAQSEDFPKTSQPSPQAFLDIFRDAKEKKDDVICILLSSELSGTYQSAVLARGMADYGNIYLIDSLSATYVIRILADYACSLRDRDMTARDIANAVESLKPRVKVAAALDTLEYLYKGGRLSKTAATIGELASLKPLITLTEQGKIGILGKCLGKNKAICGLVKHLKEAEPDPAYPLYTIYSYGTSNCERFEEKLTAEGFHTTKRLQVGSTIGAHIGPEAFGIIYVTR